MTDSSPSPPPLPIVTDDVTVTVSTAATAARDDAVDVHQVLVGSNVNTAHLSATCPPPHPPPSTSSTSEPSVWTPADIIDRGTSQQWSEQQYNSHRPSGFTGLQEQGWARLDAAIGRRRHDRQSEAWELTFSRVGDNLRRSATHDDRRTAGAESSVDETRKGGGEAITMMITGNSTPLAGALRLVVYVLSAHATQQLWSLPPLPLCIIGARLRHLSAKLGQSIDDRILARHLCTQLARARRWA